MPLLGRVLTLPYHFMVRRSSLLSFVSCDHRIPLPIFSHFAFEKIISCLWLISLVILLPLISRTSHRYPSIGFTNHQSASRVIGEGDLPPFSCRFMYRLSLRRIFLLCEALSFYLSSVVVIVSCLCLETASSSTLCPHFVTLLGRFFAAPRLLIALCVLSTWFPHLLVLFGIFFKEYTLLDALPYGRFR